MKINIYLSTAVPSGGTYILLEYAKRLQQNGNDVICYCITTPPTFKDAKGKEKLLCRFPLIKLRELRHYIHIKKDIINLFARYPDVRIKIVSSTDSKYVRRADAGLAGSWPAAYTLYMDDKVGGKKAYLIQGLENWDFYGRGLKSYKLPLINLCISTQLKQIITANGYGKVTDVVYNGIDLNKFRNDDKQYRHNGKIVCSMKYVVAERSGVPIGLEAYRRVKARHPELELILFGVLNRPSLDLDFRYIRHANIDQMVDIYNSSDVYIFPTIFEGWGLPPIEAMSCKCAVVGSNTGSMKEIGVNGYNALLGTPGDVDILTYNLEKVVDDLNLQKKISNNGRSSVEKLSWDTSVRKLEHYLSGRENR